MIEHRHAAASMQCVLPEGSGLPFPSVPDNADIRNMDFIPAQITSRLQTRLRAAGMEHTRFTLHSCRVGGATSHHIDGTALDLFIRYVGWRSEAAADRNVGVTAPAAIQKEANGSCDTAFIKPYSLPLSEGFVESCAALPQDNRHPPSV